MEKITRKYFDLNVLFAGNASHLQEARNDTNIACPLAGIRMGTSQSACHCVFFLFYVRVSVCLCVCARVRVFVRALTCTAVSEIITDPTALTLTDRLVLAIDRKLESNACFNLPSLLDGEILLIHQATRT